MLATPSDMPSILSKEASVKEPPNDRAGGGQPSEACDDGRKHLVTDGDQGGALSSPHFRWVPTDRNPADGPSRASGDAVNFQDS